MTASSTDKTRTLRRHILFVALGLAASILLGSLVGSLL